MELQGDAAQVESRFGPFRDGISVRARKVHGLCQTYHRVRNHFGRTRWYSKLTRLKWKHVSVHLETMLIMTHYWCLICAEHTIGSENHFGHTQ
jgi:hypothetical protein